MNPKFITITSVAFCCFFSNISEIKATQDTVIGKQQACTIEANVTSKFTEPYKSTTCMENISLKKAMFEGLCNAHQSSQGDIQATANVTYSEACPSSYYGTCVNTTPAGQKWKIFYYEKKDVMFSRSGEPLCDEWEYGLKK